MEYLLVNLINPDGQDHVVKSIKSYSLHQLLQFLDEMAEKSLDFYSDDGFFTSVKYVAGQKFNPKLNIKFTLNILEKLKEALLELPHGYYLSSCLLYGFDYMGCVPFIIAASTSGDFHLSTFYQHKHYPVTLSNFSKITEVERHLWDRSYYLRYLLLAYYKGDFYLPKDLIKLIASYI